jgi:hypothetical protein
LRLERYINASTTKNVSEKGRAQIIFLIFLRHVKTCNKNGWRNVGEVTKTNRNEQKEKLTNLVEKRSDLFYDGQKPRDKKRQY